MTSGSPPDGQQEREPRPRAAFIGARARAGVAQAEVARAIGVTRQQISNYEAGRTDLPAEKWGAAMDYIADAARMGMPINSTNSDNWAAAFVEFARTSQLPTHPGSSRDIMAMWFNAAMETARDSAR